LWQLIKNGGALSAVKNLRENQLILLLSFFLQVLKWNSPKGREQAFCLRDMGIDSIDYQINGLSLHRVFTDKQFLPYLIPTYHYSDTYLR